MKKEAASMDATPPPALWRARLAVGRADTQPLSKECASLADQGCDTWLVALTDFPLLMGLEGCFIRVAFMQKDAIGVRVILNDIEDESAGLCL